MKPLTKSKNGKRRGTKNRTKKNILKRNIKKGGICGFSMPPFQFKPLSLFIKAFIEPLKKFFGEDYANFVFQSDCLFLKKKLKDFLIKNNITDEDQTEIFRIIDEKKKNFEQLQSIKSYIIEYDFNVFYNEINKVLENYDNCTYPPQPET